MTLKNQIKVVATLGLVFSAVSGCSPPTLQQNGGYVVTYHAETSSADDDSWVVKALKRRLKHNGFPYAAVKAESGGNFVIELPATDKEGVERLRQVIDTMGHLEFRILARPGIDDKTIATALNENSPAATPKYRWVKLETERIQPDQDMVVRGAADSEQEVLVLIDSHNVSGADLSLVHATYDENLRPCLGAGLTKDGARRMKAFTSRNIKRRLGVVFNDTLLTAPILQSAIGDSLQLTGDFTQAEVDLMVVVLQSGSLPTRLDREPVEVRKVEPVR